MTTRHKTLCIVGAGPRGLSVLERLCANERAESAHSALTVHVGECPTHHTLGKRSE